VCLQGANPEFIENTENFPSAKVKYELLAECDGYISAMDAEKIGLAAAELGAGRKTKEDSIDFAAGIILKRKTGDKIKRGEPIATLYTNDKDRLSLATKLFKSALTISNEETANEPLIFKIIRE
jgi:pyrimidine-nucleoside phosphorylase